MNLAALWAHERARVCAQAADTATHGCHTDPGTAKRPSAHGVVTSTSSSSPTSKKKTSVAPIRRESVFRHLLEDAAMPLAEAASALHVQQLHDQNEFAIEFADRAPKRFAQSPATPNDATIDVDGNNDSHHHTVATKQHPASGSRRRSNGLAPMAVVPPAPTSTTLSPLSPQLRSTSATPSARATIVKASPVVANGARRNQRKRGGGSGTNLELSAQAFKPYIGDMFSTRGDYVDGMLYMSRMKRSHQLIFGHEATNSLEFGRSTLKEAVADALSAAVAAAAAGNLMLTGVDGPHHKSSLSAAGGGNSSTSSALASASALSEISSEELLQLKQRQRCSLTLSNWSSNPENARLMVQENVVQALILLCKASEGDRLTKLHCVTTLMNLSHVDELRSELVQQGAVKTLVEIANEETEDDKTLRTACAVTLCNLCCCSQGEEEILVEDGAVSALSLLINEHPKTSSICLGALFNLTCVKEPYHKIESVLKVFLTLASSSPPTALASSVVTLERDEILAKAICNLSNFKRIRLRLMEEGIVSAVTNLIHPNHPQIQRLLAYVLLNLSAMRACRSELVAKGCLTALIALTGAIPPLDSDAKCLVALALWNLSKEQGNRLRMVFEGLLLLVNELCRGIPAVPASDSLRTVCARTLYNVSASDETRVKLVERDAVNVLSTLSQRCQTEDGKKMCTLALCNLLSVQQAASDIVHVGAISSLIELSMVTTPSQTLDTRLLFAKALHGLCEISSTRVSVVQAGVIPAIIHLSTTSVSSSGSGDRQAGIVSEIRARTTAALACLAADETVSAQVCTPVAVRCVTQVLVQERFNITIERFCCACLSLLCRDEQCSRVVADEGGIEAVLSTCLESQDMETKASCCHVLASMSCHRSCCMALVKMGVLSVLGTLAKTTSPIGKGAGPSTQRCCAITLANLSADEEIRAILVTSSIVPLLEVLSNTYSEDSQRDCARVLCNLSSVPGHEVLLVKEGALSVLMMIGMVRALQPATKETCVRAFTNLTTRDTITSIVSEGIVKVLPAFAALSMSDEGSHASTTAEIVNVLFAKLISQREGRGALYSERAALRALIALTPREGTVGDDCLYEKLLCEVVFCDELRQRSVDAGIVDALHQLSKGVMSPHTVPRIAKMLFTLAKHEDTRFAAASTTSLSTLCGLLDPARGTDGGDHIVFTVSTVCHLAWHDETRERLNPQDVTTALVRLLSSQLNTTSAVCQHVVAISLLALCCLSHSDDHLAAMLDADILSRLCDIVQHDTSYATLPFASILFRQLSNSPSFASVVMRSASQSATMIRLLCLFSTAAVAVQDESVALDCADALCSITFITPMTKSSNTGKRPVPFIRRQSQPQLAGRGSMAVSSTVPPSALVSQEVLTAIRELMSMRAASPRLAEMRWRCTAALFAFSCIADYRHTLVKLGCTSILVAEASSAHKVSSPLSPVDLATLLCCAGALSNLTIVFGSESDNNAAMMVRQEAVPALIQLAKSDNVEIREYCTLALSNLSAQSPKVESGAVSALLNLSLSTATSLAAHPSPHVGVSRPPPVIDVRYKEIVSLPDIAIEHESLEDVLAKKYEAAQGQGSQPPPPRVPVMSANFVMIGGLQQQAGGGTADQSVTSDGNNGEEMGGLRRRKSSSIGDLTGTSPVSTPVTGSSSSGRSEGGVDGDLRGWPTMTFPKIDPAESRALSMAMEESVAPAETPNQVGQTTDDHLSVSTNPEPNSSLQPDPRSESEDQHQGSGAKSKAKNGTISPLARVVIRKTQTSQAINKLKDLRAGGSRGSPLGSVSVSSSALPLATVQEAHEGGSTAGDRLHQHHRQSSSTTKIHKLIATKEQDTHQPKGRDRNESPTASEDAEHKVHDEAHVDPVDDSTTSQSIAAAAAAAMLYSAAPVSSSPVTRPPPKSTLSAKSSKTKKTQAITTPATLPDRSVPVRSAAVFVSTVEEIPSQAKLLGLWN